MKLGATGLLGLMLEVLDVLDNTGNSMHPAFSILNKQAGTV